MKRRDFLKVAGASALALSLPLEGLLLPEPPKAKIKYDLLSAEAVRSVAKRMRELKIPTFDDGYWHAMIHPDAEFDLLSDKTITIFGPYVYPSPRTDDPLIRGVMPSIYGIKFFRSSDAPVERARSANHQAAWGGKSAMWITRTLKPGVPGTIETTRITLNHYSSVAEHLDDVYSSVFYGPGSWPFKIEQWSLWSK